MAGLQTVCTNKESGVDLSDPRLLELLREMARRTQECELTARLTGDNFNVFKILDLRTAEVRTHSAFIAELLDPHGSHGQGATYLRLFLKQLEGELVNFDPNTAKVEVEHHIGAVDYERAEGGRIDIMVSDADNAPRILIENKIWAGDVEKQLLRYHHFSPTAALVYLTLHGTKPNPISTGGEKFPFTLMSYRDHILQWLDECHRVSVSLPVVRETIQQYKCLIRELTHQSTGYEVIEIAKELILDLKNRDLADAVALLGEAWQGILVEARTEFGTQMDETMPPTSYSLAEGIIVERHQASDGESGVWIGFRAVGGDDRKPCEEAQKYADFVRSRVPFLTPSPYCNIGWFNPEPFKPCRRFDDLPKATILSLYRNKVELMKVVSRVQLQADAVTKQLLVDWIAVQVWKETAWEPYRPA